MKRQYQVVMEFHDDSAENFEHVLALETKLEAKLASGEVDGNDVGQGVVNIFIITTEPERCFKEAMQIIGDEGPSPAAAGYRELNEADYVRLWPKGDATSFQLR